jgi:hypothetical protein
VTPENGSPVSPLKNLCYNLGMSDQTPSPKQTLSQVAELLASYQVEVTYPETDGEPTKRCVPWAKRPPPTAAKRRPVVRPNTAWQN